jgi:hypothetical protein
MAQTDYQEKTIGGVLFRVSMLDPFTAGDMANDLGRVLSPLLGSAMGLKDLQSIMNSEATPEQMSAIQTGLQAFFAGFNKQQQREFMKTLASVTVVKVGNGMLPLDSIFETQFQGKIKDMYEWLVFALKVQFSDLFKGLGSAMSLANRASQPE